MPQPRVAGLYGIGVGNGGLGARERHRCARYDLPRQYQAVADLDLRLALSCRQRPGFGWLGACRPDDRFATRPFKDNDLASVCLSP